MALMTDGRFSGGSHGFIVGHVTPEAQVGGPIGLIKNGDVITIDAEKNEMSVDLSDEEMAARKGRHSVSSIRLSTRGQTASSIQPVYSCTGTRLTAEYLPRRSTSRSNS